MIIHWFFIWTNLNPLHLRMLCAKFGWNWPSGSGEEEIFNLVNVFSLFRNYLPLEKVGAFHLNKLESPSPKDALSQVWLKLTQWFWRKRWESKQCTPKQRRRTTDKFWSEKLTFFRLKEHLKRVCISQFDVDKMHFVFVRVSFLYFDTWTNVPQLEALSF